MLQCIVQQIIQSVKKRPIVERNGNIKIFLATDGALLRKELAGNIRDELSAAINRPGIYVTSPRVEIDYFRSDLEPAHYIVWTYKFNELKEVLNTHIYLNLPIV